MKFSVFYIDNDNNFTECNKKLDEDNYKKGKKNLRELLQQKEKKNNNIISENDLKDPSSSNEQIKDNNPSVLAFENYRHVFIGPSKVGKRYYMLKTLEKTGNKRSIHKLTPYPIQYPNYKTDIEIK